jgi:hypothetical protein
LWDISAMFLRDPWYWPEIWYANPQVRNPHLIYPGDVLTLVYMDGRPRIMLERAVARGRRRATPAARPRRAARGRDFHDSLRPHRGLPEPSRGARS